MLEKPWLDKQCQLITPGIVKAGQKALANFFVNKIATNEKGEIGLICTDKSRKMFKYMRTDGKIVTDIDGVDIIQKFKVSSILEIRKSLLQIKNEYASNPIFEDEEEWMDCYKEIETDAHAFGDKFVFQLVKRTYKKTEDGQLVEQPAKQRK